jgi:hypothetical protein
MTQEQINELRKLAQAATPGPWTVDTDTDAFTGGPHVMTEDGAGLFGAWDGQYEIDSDAQTTNAAYIAAANPAAILALIQQRDELLAAIKQERKRLDWALTNEAVYYQWGGVWRLCFQCAEGPCQQDIDTTDPRATIDELME